MKPCTCGKVNGHFGPCYVTSVRSGAFLGKRNSGALDRRGHELSTLPWAWILGHNLCQAGYIRAVDTGLGHLDRLVGWTRIRGAQ